MKILIKNRLFVAANATVLFNYLGIFSISFLMSFFFIDVLGFSPLKTGLILAITPLTMAVLSPIAGHLSDKIGSRFLSSLGIACITVGLIITITITIIISLLTSSELMKKLIFGTAKIIEAKIEFITGMHYIFLLFAVITFLGIFTSLARGKNK